MPVPPPPPPPRGWEGPAAAAAVQTKKETSVFSARSRRPVRPRRSKTGPAASAAGMVDAIPGSGAGGGLPGSTYSRDLPTSVPGLPGLGNAEAGCRARPPGSRLSAPGPRASPRGRSAPAPGTRGGVRADPSLVRTHPRPSDAPWRRPTGTKGGYLVDPASSICLSQRLSHASLSTHGSVQ